MAVRFPQGVFSGDNTTQVDVTPVSHEDGEVRFIVDVYREHTEAVNVFRGAREVDLVRPGGTVVNIGAGPNLPSNPYEGQVWILT